MSATWTETEIAAFLSGALGGADADRIAAALETDPAAQDAAERLAAPAPLDAALRDAYAAPLDEPVPAALTAAVLGAPGKVTALRPRGGGARWPTWVPSALAASLALAVGLGAGLGLRAPQQSEAAVAALSVGAASGDALAAFETGRAGEALAGLRLAASFRDGAGRACREFETVDAAGVTGGGVACRDAGAWRVLILAAAPEAATQPADGFAPAGGAAADPLGAFLDAIAAGPALSPEEEADLIARGWR